MIAALFPDVLILLLYVTTTTLVLSMTAALSMVALSNMLTVKMIMPALGIIVTTPPDASTGLTLVTILMHVPQIAVIQLRDVLTTRLNVTIMMLVP
jgi:hypothetical protein